MLTEEEKKQEWQARSVSTGSAELETLISTALRKIGGKKENDLCRYLPMSTGGYMHHFTLRKKKQKVPQELFGMIKQFIIDPDKPMPVTPKRRNRGANKKKGQPLLSETDIHQLLQLARSAGDREMIRKLTPRKELKTVKRELISSIRRGLVDYALWESYVEAMS